MTSEATKETSRSTYVRICLTAALALLASLAFSGVASAHHPAGTSACGQVVTGDLTLTHDVGPCPAASGTNGAALTIKASGTPPDNSTSPPTPADYVTLNLNGWKVYGCDNANPTGPCNSLNVDDPSLKEPFVTGEGPGIVIDRQDYVKITDSPTSPPPTPGPGPGTVSDFDTGIVLRGGSKNVIEEVDVKRNVGTAVTDSDYGEGIGIYAYLKEDDDPDTDPSTAAGRLAPTVLANWTASTDNTVTANNVVGNGPYAGIAAYNFDDTFPGPVAPTERDGSGVIRGATDANTIGGSTSAAGNTVTDSYVVPNGTTYQDDGIRIEPKATNTTVQYNTVTGSSLDGIAVFADAVGTKVQNNIVRGNGSQPLASQRKGDGIVVFQRANNVTVSDNTVGGSNGPTDTTVPAEPPPPSTQGNAGNGIRVDSTGVSVPNTSPTPPTLYPNTITNNTATGNGYNTLVNGTSVPDPRGVADPESQYRYYDLRDGQRDKACGNTAPFPSPPPAPWPALSTATPNSWTGNGVTTAGVTRNRAPGYADCIA